MRLALVLVVAPALLLAYPAGAQVAVDQTEAQPSPVEAAPVAPKVEAEKPSVVRPPVVRWAPRPRVRVQAQRHQPVQRPLPSSSKTSAPGREGMAPIKIVVPTAEAASAGAATLAIPAEAAAPVLLPDPETTTPELPAAKMPVQAVPVSDAQARPAPASAGPTADTVWLEPVAGTAMPTILLKTEPDVGLAAFRSGAETVVVLDAPVDFQAPAKGLDPAFAQFTSRRTQDATVIRIPMASGTLRLARNARGWLLMAGSPPDTAASIIPRLIKNGPDTASIQFTVSEPSSVVTVLDPQTGDQLLVGTQGAVGQAIPNAWQQAKFSLRPTLQGIVVVATSDDMRLRRGGDGFTLSAGPLADSSIIQDAAKQEDASAPIAGAVSRLFDIPNGSAADLIHELDDRVGAAGDAHALARSEPRLRVAAAMLALGMDVEAQSVIDVAAAADPTLMDKRRAIGLRAVASVLAGRFEDANGLADPRLSGSTEIELWRAYLQAAKGEATAKDARSLSVGLPLVLAYPRPLRDRMLPTVLETMALNGQAEAVQTALRTLPPDRTLDLVRGMVLEMTDQTAAALQAYDRLVDSPDRLRRYKAQMRAAELRIKTGELDARAGADVLDRALFGWRGAKQELALRIRIAGLRRQTGQWQQALAVLREGRDAFPDDHAQLDRELATTFIGFITNDAVRNLTPAEFVAIYDKNIGLVQDVAWNEQVGTDLVDRLIGLGLQGRAEPIMTRLVAQSTDPIRRVVLGTRLSDLRMSTDDPSGAIAALADTAPPSGIALNPAVMEARQLLYAHAEAARGNTDSALGMLNTLGTAKADVARADIYASRKDWPQVVAALTAWEHKETATTDLTDQQRAVVTQLVSAATLSGNTAALEQVAATYGPAMAKGSSAALFRVLTSAPVRENADLPRAFEEIQLARQLPGKLDAMGTP
ncbi:MAG: hypothetical protein P4L71_01230 [Acetobacteraceae bacterium]|nr:hypothetical protein [Acetobacteraceae bacterium]